MLIARGLSFESFPFLQEGFYFLQHSWNDTLVSGFRLQSWKDLSQVEGVMCFRVLSATWIKWYWSVIVPVSKWYLINNENDVAACALSLLAKSLSQAWFAREECASSFKDLILCFLLSSISNWEQRWAPNLLSISNHHHCLFASTCLFIVLHPCISIGFSSPMSRSSWTHHLPSPLPIH